MIVWAGLVSMAEIASLLAALGFLGRFCKKRGTKLPRKKAARQRKHQRSAEEKYMVWQTEIKASPGIYIYARGCCAASRSRCVFCQYFPRRHLELDGLRELALLAHDLGIALLDRLPRRVGEDVIHSLGYEFAVQLASHLCQKLLVRARTERRRSSHSHRRGLRRSTQKISPLRRVPSTQIACPPRR